MTETVQAPAPPARKRKVRAIMAGGLVLGVGAAVTLAAWNDSEFAQGIFTTGQFNLEGSVDGAAFDDNDTEASAAQMTFSAGNMVPGETTYAPFWVRLDAATTVNGAIAEDTGLSLVSADNAGAEDNTEAFSYSVYQIPADTTCGPAAADGGTAIAAAETFGASDIGPATSINLAAGDADAPGSAVQLCFEITADDETLAQGTTTTATWEVTATSDDAE